MTITYGRPYKKGREIFGKLEPFGKVYRVGADEATTITFKNDATFGGKPVKAGTYALFAIPNEKEWTIIFNSETGQWGDTHDGKANFDPKKNVLEVTAKVKDEKDVQEKLLYSISDKEFDRGFTIRWEKVKVFVSVK